MGLNNKITLHIMVKIRTILLLWPLLLFTECTWHPYQPPIQQGNVMADSIVNQLHKGMTEEQVRFLLGTPALKPSFKSNRWDYVYTYQKGNGLKPTTKRIILIFKDHALVEIKAYSSQ